MKNEYGITFNFFGQSTKTEITEIFLVRLR